MGYAADEGSNDEDEYFQNADGALVRRRNSDSESPESRRSNSARYESGHLVDPDADPKSDYALYAHYAHTWKNKEDQAELDNEDGMAAFGNEDSDASMYDSDTG